MFMDQKTKLMDLVQKFAIPDSALDQDIGGDEYYHLRNSTSNIASEFAYDPSRHDFFDSSKGRIYPSYAMGMELNTAILAFQENARRAKERGYGNSSHWYRKEAVYK